ncbi:xanthine dehydrogenase subunit D [Salibacterium salarium]|uniref:Xanthine dehydrogenase subunit D n=1 Tax=Salibacterium salarium TaxID=284579 RepID=A0A428N1S0_9BACI|nr:xanthine dehydrogenase subunit D [Salibacterium salarium]
MSDGQKKIRPDGVPKVTGELTYLTDVTCAGMLYGKILRSAYPHARITNISTEHALKMPGVRAVVTHEDIKGLNGYGIVMPDQPVLCEDKVRYVGDAIAAVAADSLKIAEAALERIDITYETLPILDDPAKSLQPDAPLLHPEGNIMHKTGHTKGEGERGFSQCDVIVEETYEVPRQMHTYMETEGGVIVPEADGGISVYMGTQHGFKDRFQLSRILDIPEDSIRVVSSPMGGSFGGKDELNVQPYAALLALKCGLPVKIHQTRKESVISGIKRHPMKISMKTGTDKNGHILAHKVDIVADTGAYSTLGPAILDFAVEHSTGPYIIPHVVVEGISVFTNNGVAGEFRGFGGNQVTFALEGQMDRLAEKLSLSSIDLRKRNLRTENDLGPLGQRIAPTNGARDVLHEMEHSFTHGQTKKKEPWKRCGTGIAVTMHGGGLGYGRMDSSGGRLSFTKEGKIEIAFGFEEFGQGILAVIETIVTEELGCTSDDIIIRIGDTEMVPATGSTTASRGTSMVWNAVQRMKKTFQEQVLEKAAKILELPLQQLSIGCGGIYNNQEKVLTFENLASCIEKENPVIVTTSFDFPTTPDEIDSGHFLYTFAAVKAEVEVDVRTGRVKVLHMDQAISAGPVVNELGYRGQIEGGGVMSIGYALMEEAVMEEGSYLTDNLDTYMIPGITDVPFDMRVEAVETLPENDPYGPRGVGEIGTVAVAPAITKAIHDAAGIWINRLPVSPEKVLKAMMEGEE